MEKCIRSSTSANAGNNADNIKHAIELLKRLTDEYVYFEESMKPFYKKFSNYKYKHHIEPCEDNPELYKLIDMNNNDTPEQNELKIQCFNQENEITCWWN